MSNQSEVVSQPNSDSKQERHAVEPSRSSGALVMNVGQALFVAFVAGLAVWGILRAIMPLFVMPAELAALSGPAIAPHIEEINAYNEINPIKNATVSIAILAAALAIVFSGLELILRGQFVRAIFGSILAAILAAAIASGGGAAAGALHVKTAPQGNPPQHTVPPLVRTVLLQGTLLGIAGLGIGLGVALVLPRSRPLATCVAGGIAGGLITAFVFPIVVGLTMASANTEELVPDHSMARLAWAVMSSGLIGLTLAGLGKERTDNKGK